MKEGTTITITLDRADWVSIGKELIANRDKIVDVAPVAKLLGSLVKNGIQTSELDPKEGKDNPCVWPSFSIP